LIDNEYRMFIIEGKSDGVMKELAEKVPITDPNTDTFKIFRNLDVRFRERLYADFNLEIKRIRLRENLKKNFS